jgi:hypothetical protein
MSLSHQGRRNRHSLASKTQHTLSLFLVAGWLANLIPYPLFTRAA